MAFECCICGIQLNVTTPKTYFCSRCFREYQTDILANAEWVRYLVNNEQTMRSYGVYMSRGKIRRVIFVPGLGSDYDVANRDGKTLLIPRNRDRTKI